MKRQRITITLEPEIISVLDTLVDHSQIRNRSHAIEHTLKSGLGIHALQQVFIFINELSTPDSISDFLTLLLPTGVRTLYLSAPSQAEPQRLSVEAAIARHPNAEQFQIELVPADFGSGGSLLLKKAQLEQPFLMLWLNQATQLPAHLVAAYHFHRSHGSLLTQLLHHHEAAFEWGQLAIAQPELLSQIPAGFASIEQILFPELIKAGRVRAYLE